MQNQKGRLSNLNDDFHDDAPFKARLHALFNSIEKEFELLYLENLARKFYN